MIYVSFIILGIAALVNIPLSPLPDVDIMEVVIHAERSGTSAAEMESSVTRGLADQLKQLHQLVSLRSDTRDGACVIRAGFDFGANIDYAFAEANEKIDLAMKWLPRDMERPRVVRSGVTDIPVFYVDVSLRNGAAEGFYAPAFVGLSDFSKKVIKRRLEQLQDIAAVDISGVSSEEIYIIPDKHLMNELNVSEEDVKEAVRHSGSFNGSITASRGGLEYNIHFVSDAIASVEDVRKVYIDHHGRPLYLKDIAEIGIRQGEVRGACITDGRRSVSMAIIKQPYAKIDVLRHKVKSMLDNISRQYPAIRFDQSQDQTALLEYSISNLKQDLLAGSLIAFFLMLLFLGNLRSSLIVGVTIPVSLILTILLFYVAHITVNIISLSGLVLGVGLMVDNSIIVIDNISQHLENEMPLADACVKGTNEIVRPLISSMLTTCSVFVPLIFLSGISGALFYDQAMAIAIGLIISLVVSITLLPVLYFTFYQRKMGKGRAKWKTKGAVMLERWYNAGFEWVFDHKLLTVVVVAGWVVLAIWLLPKLRRERLPFYDRPELEVSIDWGNSIDVDENFKRVNLMMNSLGYNVRKWNCQVGRDQYLLGDHREMTSSEAIIYITTPDESSVGRVRSLMQEWVKGHYRQTVMKTTAPRDVFEMVFGDNEPDLVAQIAPFNDEGIPRPSMIDSIAMELERKFAGINVSPIAMQKVITLRLDPDKMLLYKLSIAKVADDLKAVLNSEEISALSDLHEIRLVNAGRELDVKEVLERAVVVNGNNIPIPLSVIVKIGADIRYKALTSDAGGVFVPISLQAAGKEEEVMTFMNKASEGRYGLRFTGSYFSRKALIREMMTVLAIAVLLLYFILSSQFESLAQPVIVLMELPISLGGALILLYFGGSSVNLISLIGLIVICGIVINDSILKIDAINRLRSEEGYDLASAIHTGGIRRLRSIVMTSMTTVLSILPFFFGHDMGSVLQRPLSIALIGGMLIGTPVSLYFIPLMYWSYYHYFGKIKRPKVNVTT